MKICYFNFNNEVDQFEIHVEDDGSVTVPGENGDVLGQFASVAQMAEIYAQSRDVKPENLKNWVLLENGNVYTYVLRAGTAGVSVAEKYGEIEAALDALNGYHPLSIARAKEQILSDGDKEVTEALVHCTETDIARDVYDALAAAENEDAGTETEAEAEPVDDRTDLERYVDETEEKHPGAVRFFGILAGLTGEGVTMDDVKAALAASIAFSNVNTLRAAFENVVRNTIDEGIGVTTVEDAITILTQTASGVKDDSVKARLVAGARMARRDKLNVSVDVVGEKHIRHTAEMVSLDDIEALDVYVRDNVPYIVRFDTAVDAELEAQRDAVTGNTAHNENEEYEKYEENDEEYWDEEEEDY